LTPSLDIIGGRGRSRLIDLLIDLPIDSYSEHPNNFWSRNRKRKLGFRERGFWSLNSLDTVYSAFSTFMIYVKRRNWPTPSEESAKSDHSLPVSSASLVTLAASLSNFVACSSLSCSISAFDELYLGIHSGESSPSESHKFSSVDFFLDSPYSRIVNSAFEV